MSYHFSKKVDLSFDDAIEKVTGLLKDEGFGILTEIDVKQTLKNKIDVDSLESNEVVLGYVDELVNNFYWIKASYKEALPLKTLFADSLEIISSLIAV